MNKIVVNAIFILMIFMSCTSKTSDEKLSQQEALPTMLIHVYITPDDTFAVEHAEPYFGCYGFDSIIETKNIILNSYETIEKWRNYIHGREGKAMADKLAKQYRNKKKILGER